MILELLRLLFGYIKIKIKSGYAEGFLNLCLKNGVDVYDISPKKGGEVTFCTMGKNEKKCKDLGEKIHCEIDVLERKGLCFFIKRNQKRIAFPIFGGLFLASIFMLSQMVWTIDVVGGGVEEEEVLSVLQENDLYVGCFFNRVNTDFVESKVIIELLDISHCAITKEGVRVTVTLQERDKKPDFFRTGIPSNIVAKENGQILEMTVREGVTAKKVGEGVLKGDILISGVQAMANSSVRYLQSRGEIIAETYYKKNIVLPIIGVRMQRTGEQIVRETATLFSFPINLFKNSSIPYVKYDNIIKEQSAQILGKDLPIKIKTQTFYEVIEVPYERTIDELVATACDGFEKELQGKEIIKKDVQTENLGADVLITVNYTCKENIAEEREIIVEWKKNE